MAETPIDTLDTHALDASTIVDHKLCQDVLASLDGSDYEIVNLYGFGFTDTEIAKRLNTTKDAVKLVIARVRRQLRRECSSDID